MVPANLRWALVIFSVGFAVESVGAFVVLLRATGSPIGPEFLTLFSPLFTLAGLLLLWVGRFEWNELHRRRVRHAHLAFYLSLLTIAAVVAPLAIKGAEPSIQLPSWIGIEFFAAIVAAVAVTFLTYALVSFHLVGSGGRAALILAVLWATAVGILIGQLLAAQFDTFVQAATDRRFDVGPALRNIRTEEGLLGVSYLLLLAGYIQAHRRVARGAPTDGAPSGPTAA